MDRAFLENVQVPSGSQKDLTAVVRSFFVMYYVYILYSKSSDVYYKGFSENVEKRLEYHLNSKGKYTSGVTDWIIVYVKEFSDKSEALKEEKRMKKLNRKSLEKLIKG